MTRSKSSKRINLRNMVRKRAGMHCEKCGERIRRGKGKTNGSIHHRWPRRLGGTNTPHNLVLLCIPCHVEIHKDEEAASKHGWFCYEEPVALPVRLAPGYWVLLAEDCTYVPVSVHDVRQSFPFLDVEV